MGTFGCWSPFHCSFQHWRRAPPIFKWVMKKTFWLKMVSPLICSSSYGSLPKYLAMTSYQINHMLIFNLILLIAKEGKIVALRNDYLIFHNIRNSLPIKTVILCRANIADIYRRTRFLFRPQSFIAGDEDLFIDALTAVASCSMLLPREFSSVLWCLVDL